MTHECYSTTTVQRGFDDPVLQTQQCFRAVLTAMSHPGTVVTVPEPKTLPGGLNSGTCAVLLTLADMDTPVWLDRPGEELARYLRFHCGSPIVSEREKAAFGVYVTGMKLNGLDLFFTGSAENPDRSATLIVQADAIEETGNIVLTGPGIRDQAGFGVSGVDGSVWSLAAENREVFPLGVDLIVTAGCRAVAVPRSVSVEVTSCM